MKCHHRNENISIWATSENVVAHFYGTVREDDVRILIASLKEQSQNHDHLIYYSIVDETASLPSLLILKMFSEALEKLDCLVVVASLFLAKGFKAAVHRAVADTLSSRTAYDSKAFSNTAKLCTWLKEHPSVKSPITVDEIERIVDA